MEKISVFKPLIGNDVKIHLDKAFKIGWLGMGNYTKEFENKIPDFMINLRII